MAKSVADYKKEIVRQLKANGTYSKGLDMQIISLASAMRNLEMANNQIDNLTETTVWETTRYGEKLAPHPVFKIAKEAQELITRQMKALGLTAEELAGGVDDDPLADLTKKLNKKRKTPVVIKPDGSDGEVKRKKQQLRQIFIPLTAAEIIWDYVDKVLRYCADHKISETVKLSRAVKALRASYDAELDRHLDRRHRYLVRAACDDFKQNFSYDLTVMFCTIANELNHKYVGQDILYQEMRVNALGSIMLLRALRSMPDMARLPKLRDLDEIMDAYVAPYELDLTRNVEVCQKVLAKRLAEVPDMECKLQV